MARGRQSRALALVPSDRGQTEHCELSAAAEQGLIGACTGRWVQRRSNEEGEEARGWLSACAV